MVSVEGYFRYVQEKFLEAAVGGGEERRFDFQLGPAKVAFRFANPALIPSILPAFAHLPPADGASELGLSIDLWDSQTSGLLLKPPPWNEVRGGRVYFCESPHSVLFDYSAQVLCLYDAQRRHGIFWTPGIESLPYFEVASPLRVIFDWFFSESSLQMMHAGAVGNGDAALLLVGKGGSGKSTTCSLAFQSGLDFLGDDFCLVDTEKPRVYSLYASSKLCSDVVERFPELKAMQRHSPRSPEEKATFFFGDKFAGKIPPSLPLKAVTVPRIRATEESSFRRATALETLTALAPSTVLLLSGSGDQGFKKSAGLLRRIPSYALELGRDFKGVASTLRTLLEQL
ncbi:MAG TPA: hypothetical protein VJP40_08535 [bacterium]|nr:hypothetical protein [bacterium]